MNCMIKNSATAESKSVTTQPVTVSRWQSGRYQPKSDLLAEEVPVAMVFNGISHAVMMALPENLELLALGFSLTEGIIESADEFYDLEVVEQNAGYELRMSISSQRMSALKERRRNLTGRTGCGLCGTESLEQAIRPVTPLAPSKRPTDPAVQQALLELRQHQPLQELTGACHGAAWCDQQGRIQFLYEDVGRHNALDKLIGGLHRRNEDLNDGFVLISSRASFEMVQKLAAVRLGSLVAVSAPTSLAVNIARKANINLIAFARQGRHQIYSECLEQTT
ncbi:sulfurtransferase FdhD [Endozoicomonas sp. OPT23]|uniref:formate dehydrogenase accessory sulfurtransferase FdhD n=1 Tax=Endozoicomonas sp. OPT23 TaxID=2072845 RepID=UPI00129B7A9A|nr:formate dehydrogenase accessory sulfurtransferase FdhD [Endozoicomonas sp. OPT23]MRI33153.1 sulfurtransferase FdhD [Endozoicomonas sp. OPT23]